MAGRAAAHVPHLWPGVPAAGHAAPARGPRVRARPRHDGRGGGAGGRPVAVLGRRRQGRRLVAGRGGREGGAGEGR